MDTSTVVFEQEFDKALLEHIDTLRTIRLNMAESMLKDMAKTASELVERGLVHTMDTEELRRELTERITTQRERLANPKVVYSDEIDLCIDLLDDSDAADDADLESDELSIQD